MTTMSNTNNAAAAINNVVPHEQFLIELPTAWEPEDKEDQEFMDLYLTAVNSVRDKLEVAAKKFADDLIADGQTTSFGRYRKAINASATKETQKLSEYIGEHPACDSLIFTIELAEERRILIS